MLHPVTLFIGTFTTMLAVINPTWNLSPSILNFWPGGMSRPTSGSPALPVLCHVINFFLSRVRHGNALYFFRILSMVRIVGGIILMRIGFSLFLPSPGGGMFHTGWERLTGQELDIAFGPWPCR